MPALYFYKLHPSVKIPKIATEGSACFDLEYQPGNHTSVKIFNYKEEKGGSIGRSIFDNGTFYIEPMERALIPTGLKSDIPKGYHVKVHPRSSVALKRGLPIVNCTGIIDSDYVDEWFIPLINLNHHTVYIEPGERLAQAELCFTEVYYITETENEPEYTTRSGGFGSTGK